MVPNFLQMKILTTTLILLLGFLPFSLVAQDFWEQLPFPDTARIWCFDVNSQNEIFIGTGGDNTHGCIYKSSDNGQSWSVFYDFNGELIARIGITDSDKIFVSKGGIEQLVYSDDNGESWNIIEPPPYAYLGVNEMLCVGNDTVYMGYWEEDGALLVRTVDNGQTYDSLFRTVNHTSEYIGDILVSNNEIYLGLGAYFPDRGGVYKSVDFGHSWEFLGLLNHSVSSLVLNNNNDLIAGVRGAEGNNSSGIYKLPQDENEWNTLISGPMVEDLLINEIGDIYFSSSWPQGIGISTNNGDSFEWIAEGLQDISIEELLLDGEGYIYANTPGLSNILFRSINPTVGTDPFNIDENFTKEINVYPNPAKDFISINFQESLEKYMVNIFAIDGKTLLKSISGEGNAIINIPLNDLSNGVYIIHLKSDNYSKSYKFIKH